MSDIGSAAVGSAVSGGFGIIGSLVNYALNKKLAQQQNQYNIDMWKMQAEYDSPQAQMQRFQEAGLNPNLIYGQGSNGNMNNAPQMVTPQAPELSKPMQELGKAFNIENLKTLVANRKKAEAEAKDAETDATRNSLQLAAESLLGSTYYFDPNTGSFVERPRDVDGTRTLVHGSAYYLNKALADRWRELRLIPYRAALLESQKKFLAPQIQMQNYQSKYFPTSFWIGQGSRVLNSLTSIPAIFSPLRWVPRAGNTYNYNLPY